MSERKREASAGLIERLAEGESQTNRLDDVSSRILLNWAALKIEGTSGAYPQEEADVRYRIAREVVAAVNRLNEKRNMLMDAGFVSALFEILRISAQEVG